MDAEDEFPFALDRHVQSNRPIVYCDKITGLSRWDGLKADASVRRQQGRVAAAGGAKCP